MILNVLLHLAVVFLVNFKTYLIYDFKRHQVSLALLIDSVPCVCEMVNEQGIKAGVLVVE